MAKIPASPSISSIAQLAMIALPLCAMLVWSKLNHVPLEDMLRLPEWSFIASLVFIEVIRDVDALKKFKHYDELGADAIKAAGFVGLVVSCVVATYGLGLEHGFATDGSDIFIKAQFFGFVFGATMMVYTKYQLANYARNESIGARLT